jgi:ASCH domain
MLYPLGYASPQANERLASLMQHARMLLIDTRYTPYSRLPSFRREALEAHYGKRYRWAGKYLGNLNHTTGGPIRLAQPEIGIPALVRYLQEGYSLVLLCGCASYEQCHRKVIVEAVQRLMPEVEVQLEERTGGMMNKEWIPQPGYLPALSISQPHAWLILHADKDVENRGWTTHYRGPLLIHAGKRFDGFPLTQVPGMPARAQDYETGGIVGIATLIDVVTASTSPWFRGTYGWLLRDARPLPFVPLRGQLGLFPVSASILSKEEYSASMFCIHV